VLALLVVAVPVIAETTVNMIGLGILAAALLAIGRTERLPATGLGVALVALELEGAWERHPLTVQIAAAVAGLALLAAFELSSWAQQLEQTGADRAAYRAQLRVLGERLAIVAALLAVLLAAPRAIGHHPALGIAGGVAVIALGAGLLWLVARPGGRT
jgi:hypothetical protein